MPNLPKMATNESGRAREKSKDEQDKTKRFEQSLSLVDSLWVTLAASVNIFIKMDR